MSVFAIGDLHLSLSGDKSMEVFRGWENYVERIREGFESVVSDEDTVVIAGDLSWGMNLKESEKDFEFLNSLPGKKLILKGNHDYWWDTASKINRFFKEKDFSTLSLLHNNHYKEGVFAITGTRGWLLEENAAFVSADKKIAAREEGRLKLSLESAKKEGLEPIVFLHYPPIFRGGKAEGIVSIMKEYGVKKCFYGHIHSAASQDVSEGFIDGIDYKLISADHLKFKPYKVI